MQAATPQGDSATVPLFNGKNLDGWQVYTGPKESTQTQDIFSVSDGTIHVYKDKEANSKQPFACLVTEKSYSHYKLSFEYKWGEKKFAPRAEAVRDAGVLFHVLPPYGPWPKSVECQIQEGDTGDLWIIGTNVSSKIRNSKYDPKGKLEARGLAGKNFTSVPRSYFWGQPGWNKIELEVDGDYAVFKVNGHIVNEAIDMKQWDTPNEKWIPLEEGPIVLQAEGAEIFYRAIEITEL